MPFLIYTVCIYNIKKVLFKLKSYTILKSQFCFKNFVVIINMNNAFKSVN